MILIKDRHDISNYVRLAPMTGKYDTYKGSTHDNCTCHLDQPCRGKYDTY